MSVIFLSQSFKKLDKTAVTVVATHGVPTIATVYSVARYLAGASSAAIFF